MSEVTQDGPELTPWIRWPIWVLAVVVVLPFRLFWELLRSVAGFLARYVGRPLAWLWQHAIVVPVSVVWRYAVVLPFRLLWKLLRSVAGFLARYVGRPLAWLWQRAIVVPISLVLRYLLIMPVAWLWPRLVLAPLAWLGQLIVGTVDWVIRVSAPLWRLLGEALTMLLRGIHYLVRGFARWVLLPGWRGAGWVGSQFYRWLLRPVGVAVAWVWRRTVVPCGRTVATAWRWSRESVLRPTSAVAKCVLTTFGVRRRP